MSNIVQNYAIGADIGGTHITSAVVNMGNRAIIDSTLVHQPVDSSGSPEAILDAWSKTIKQSIERASPKLVTGIGIAMPGPFDYKNGISKIRGTAKFDRLYGLNIKQLLADRLACPTTSIAFINDANSFLFGESWVTEIEYQRIIGITLGTGFGAAFYKNGQVVADGVGVPADTEFFPIPFLEGMSEDYISARGIIREYQLRGGKEVPGVKMIADLAMNKDKLALDVFEDFGNKLGSFLASWLRDFEAQALIIGGNISRSADLFKPAFYKIMVDQQLDVEVITSRLLDKAAILGAARQFS